MEQNFRHLNNGAVPYGNMPVEPAAATGGMDGGAVQAAQYAGLESGLKEIFGEEFAIADAESQRMLLDYLERVTTQNEKLTAILERDPRLAQLFLDLVNGKRNAHSAVARYYGRSLMEPEEGTLEYEEMMSADEERQQEAVRLANDRKEYEENLSVSLPVIEDFCREHGYDPEEFMDNVWEEIVFPIMSGRYTREVCTALDHALTYEKDVEDAFAAGDIKGRNTNIQRMKQDFGDGLPKGVSSVSPVVEPKRKRNSLIEKALNA